MRAPTLDAVAAIRADPAGWIRDWQTKGALAVLEHLVAGAVIEAAGRDFVPAITVTLRSPWAFEARDTGRGMNFAPEPGHPVSHVEYVLTHRYPIPVADPGVAAALTDWCWGPGGGVGPVIANALAARFRVESQRDTTRWAQEYAAGAPRAAPFEVAPGEPGTTQFVRLDEPCFRGVPGLEAAAVSAGFAGLKERLPRLRLTLEDRA